MLKKLIPGVLALAMFASVNANTDVETKDEKTVVEFVTAAQALGFSNEEVKAAFVTALDNADANGVVTLSLNMTKDQKKIALIAGGVTAAVVAAGLGYYGYKNGYFTRAANNAGAPAAPAAAAPAAAAPAPAAPAAAAPAAAAPAAAAPAAPAEDGELEVEVEEAE